MSNRGGALVGCSEFHRSLALDRRSFLKAGVLGASGLSLRELLQQEAHASTRAMPTGRKPSVIILWMRGGPSHIDMWDPKPDAPPEFRGEFGTMATKVPGIRLTDMLPMCAQVMDKWSIVRSLYHADAGHSSGDQICFTGYPSGPNPDENVYPSCGSIVARQLGHLDPRLPAYVMIPRNVPGTGAAYLGAAHKAFETGADPANPGPFRLPNFELPEGVSMERVGDRKDLLAGFDKLRRDVDANGQINALDRFGRQAWDILTSPAARDAFDLDREPAPVRERYGFMPAFDPKAADRCGSPAWSQRILLARRLVEAGVRLVTVDLRWWDTHVKGFESLKLGFLPRFDRAYSALIEDLEARGLLESTMVIAWGEFGPHAASSTPTRRRDHYPNVFELRSAWPADRCRAGRVVGSSDEKGAFPKANPKRPQDVLKTMYQHLGIDTDAQYLHPTGRPISVLLELWRQAGD